MRHTVSAALQGTLSLMAVMGFVLGFACGSGPVPWIYLSEVLPNEIKGPAAALCTSLNWIANLIVGLTFPSMLAALHLGGAYSVYAVRETARALLTVLQVIPACADAVGGTNGKGGRLAQMLHRCVGKGYTRKLYFACMFGNCFTILLLCTACVCWALWHLPVSASSSCAVAWWSALGIVTGVHTLSWR